ncbi:hypothetical protein [Sedimentitalea todarodis]|uniref:Uncharacterized protein n=1 Tax=Sedimentitalea todarodis TaxID=1631240 RepID=A0ABU3VGK9_9RHOB|nr:hypothetical protein [Sedimentitalea todarodis]MDU9005316.1 hypothetical protein [Sedimentitalea todarodis]
MKPTIDRRAVLITAGAAAAVAAMPVAAQSIAVRGVVRFEGGESIPKGQVDVYVDDPAIQDASRHQRAKTTLSSDGKSKTIAFSLFLPVDSIASSAREIVARLEDIDGWLIARGSAEFKAGSTADVTLNKAIY